MWLRVPDVDDLADCFTKQPMVFGCSPRKDTSLSGEHAECKQVNAATRS